MFQTNLSICSISQTYRICSMSHCLCTHKHTHILRRVHTLHTNRKSKLNGGCKHLANRSIDYRQNVNERACWITFRVNNTTYWILRVWGNVYVYVVGNVRTNSMTSDCRSRSCLIFIIWKAFRRTLTFTVSMYVGAKIVDATLAIDQLA